MVTTLAASAAHTGLALRRRTTMNTSTANGTATSASRNIAGAGASRSTTSGSSGVSTPVTRPPMTIFKRSLREASAVIASVNIHLMSVERYTSGLHSLSSISRWSMAHQPIIFGNTTIEIKLEVLRGIYVKVHIVGRRPLRACVGIGPHPKSDEVLTALHAFLNAPLKK